MQCALGRMGQCSAHSLSRSPSVHTPLSMNKSVDDALSVDDAIQITDLAHDQMYVDRCASEPLDMLAKANKARIRARVAVHGGISSHGGGLRILAKGNPSPSCPSGTKAPQATHATAWTFQQII